MFNRIHELFHPVPERMQKQGFEPNFVIRTMRAVSRALIWLLRLNGRSRFSNEFIQTLDPKLEIPCPDGKSIVFRTGHGRLLWRARAFLDQEPMMLRWVDTFRPDDVFYDVGANVGPYCIYAAQRGIDSYAFEPELSNVQVMYENIFLNHVQDKCTPIPMPLGESTTSDVIYLKTTTKGDALHSVGRKSYLLSDNHAPETMKTIVMSLDDVIESFNLPAPTCLKIDVDSNELGILKGARKTLAHVRELHIEIDTDYEEHRQALDLLKQLGFALVEEESIGLQWNESISNCLFSKAANTSQKGQSTDLDAA